MAHVNTDLLSNTATVIRQLLTVTKLLVATSALVMACTLYMYSTSNWHFHSNSLCNHVPIVTKQPSLVPGAPAARYATAPRAQPCTEDVPGMIYLVNGQQVSSKHLWKTLKSPLPGNRLHTIQVKRTCGGIEGDSNLRNIFLRAGSTDIPVFFEIWMKQEFGFLDQLFAKQGIVPNHIMDLGMNCGLASLYFTTHFPTAQSIAVEPGLEPYAIASLNLVDQPRVFRELGAAAAQGGGYDKLLDRQRGAWGMGVDAVSVSQMTLGTTFGAFDVPYLMMKYGWDSIDYLKIDIEGSEKSICDAILAGNASWIKSVGCVTFEYHEAFVTGVTASCDAAMKTSGFRHMGKEGELTVWCKSQA